MPTRHHPARKYLALALLFSATTAVYGASPAKDARTEPTWSTYAKMDIEAIHDELKANHPAMVDRTPLGKRYQRWLKKGRVGALRDAKSAVTSADYARVLRRYITGFEDGHIAVSFNGLPDAEWPGFFTREIAIGRIEVSAVGDGAPVPVGASLVSCDGRDARQLMDELVVPYRVNPGIPQQRAGMSTRLMLSFPDDLRRPTHCKFLVDGAPRELALQWRKTDDATWPVLERATGTATDPLGMRTVDGVVFISVPSFQLSDQDVAAFRTMIGQIESDLDALHRAPYLVIDVRGNGGGNSGWGELLAVALFGMEQASKIGNSFDWSVDWRATPHNARVLRETAAQQRKNGMNESANQIDELASQMDAAATAGELYVRRPAEVQPDDKTARSPFAGKVFFLTDSSCASACLDFADLMLRMPGVAHVGLPTSADAVYIDNYSAPLPSGKASMNTSLKVYRHRVRDNNEWYTPQHAWPGGQMRLEAIAAWVKSL